ncbi:hypothetical protein BIV57_20440 [Mangrovactinospora gilvigrisea]|uniref:Bacterial transcriptional activator domain-containing protein n=1 Tax=Mangrovactinospora gilvigrisea TaxID=1428644 RepID=A0A1J7C253_9ACTN|nr:hypothetical protein [Mangrovactinospora gilvigrisea]OIV35648.1 hypothetical protein BIV57_20440 [Mangrovactinospora gilvigrisea]
MSTGTNPNSRTPVRIGRVPGRRTFGDVLRGIAALLMLAALVLGAPAALVLLIGWPLPSHIPSLDDFSHPFTAEVIVRVLAVLVWIAWAQFAACVLVEVRAAVSGIGMPARVPVAGASQALARQLVAAILLLTAGAASVTPAISSMVSQPVAVVAMQQSQQQAPHAPHTADRTARTAAVGTSAEASALTSAGAGHILDAEEHAHREALARQTAQASRTLTAAHAAVPNAPAGTKLYTVQPPHGRHHDNLWDIAQRHLGNGRRWTEIFDLNKNHDQPDGTRLTKASLIYPGWVLVMPGDAHGGDLVEVGPAHQAPQPTPQHQEHRQTPQHQQGGQHEAGGTHFTQTVPGRIALGGLVAAPLLSATLLAALGTRRRQTLWQRSFGARPYGPGGWDDETAGADEALRVGADPEGAAFLDAALRALGAQLAAAGRPLPAVYAARLDERGLELRISPPEPDAPQPWRAEEGGRMWRLERVMLPPANAPAGPAPYPGLVSLGHDLSGLDDPAAADEPGTPLVLIDLEAASGLITLTGAEPARRREVLAALAAELAVNSWSERLRLTLVGFGAELKELAPGRVRTATTLAEIIGDLEREAAERARALAAAGLDSVLSGRTGADGAELWHPHYVIVAEPPQGETAARLAALAASSHRTAITHLVGGPVPGAAWEWHLADDERRLTVPLLGLDVLPQRVPDGEYRALLTLFREAGRIARPPSAGGPAAPSPAPDPEVLGTRPSVELGLLGPLQVRGTAGEPEPTHAEQLREALVFLALHRDGAHLNVLASALWPKGVQGEVRDALVARLGDWLGTDQRGVPHLVREGDGRLRLGPGVLTDWELFRALAARAESNQPGAEESWAQALALVRGPVLDGRPAARYGWLAHLPFEGGAAAEIADTALRLAAKRLQGGRPGPASEAARAGLRGNPDDESLWYALLRTLHEAGDPAALRAAVADLLRHLRTTTGLPEPDARTTATLDELLPGWRELTRAPQPG